MSAPTPRTPEKLQALHKNPDSARSGIVGFPNKAEHSSYIITNAATFATHSTTPVSRHPEQTHVNEDHSRFGSATWRWQSGLLDVPT